MGDACTSTGGMARTTGPQGGGGGSRPEISHLALSGPQAGVRGVVWGKCLLHPYQRGHREGSDSHFHGPVNPGSFTPVRAPPPPGTAEPPFLG